LAFQNVEILERAQAKIEAVRGTAEAAATRWLYFIQGGMSWSYQQDLESVSEINADLRGDR
jgi:hypothetical protein